MPLETLPTPSAWLETDLIDQATISLLQELFLRVADRVATKEIALWLASNDALCPVIGVGHHAKHFVGTFRQPLDAGLISTVYSSGQSLCENDLQSNRRHSPTLDQKLGVSTSAIVAAPVFAASHLVGVISAVHFDSERQFSLRDLEDFEFVAACTSKFLDAVVFQELLA